MGGVKATSTGVFDRLKNGRVRAARPRGDPTVRTSAPIDLASRQVQESCFETSARWGVWLGRHICYTTTQVS
jgi:hypothetical protein